ncbi:MAG TPA: hypothetical protein PK307_05370 [Spirochaetota bacterium]|nr:hypothetical protein [Spirochaetota bacterium]HOD15086.1 hypothetical protein [Spirochaetota bacterium]HPG50330.1 hypothetical protein [Spirochaetota bacterium]HPN10563.1 hypothetical protein [Spirochaetota bacterium]HQL81609.1 hypothetical protein [Spirochaetota bacterium]
MIPRTDAIDRASRPGAINREPAIPRPAAVPAGTRSSSPVLNRAGFERALGDAFSIAQMSQNIIQRAMTISSQLKSIAANAIASGRINTQELAATLSEMRSALGRYGEQAAAPPQINAPSSVKIPEIPDISAEMKSLREISTGFQEGRFDRVSEIDGVIGRLGDKLAASVAAGDAIAGLMKGTGDAGRLEQPVPPGALAARVTEKIVSNPGTALAAQGNINYTTADRLMA